MRPQDTGCWRKTGRRALRGIPAGRRATHQVRTAYGRHQKDRDWRMAWLRNTAWYEMEASLAARAEPAQEPRA